jgi:hypothetical protein
MSNEKIIFILGVNRSGTSLLSRMLIEHDNIIPTFDVKNPKLKFNNHTQAYCETSLPEFDKGKTSKWGLKENLFQTLNVNYKKCYNDIASHLYKSKKYFLIKKPILIFHIKFLIQHFKNAKFILNIRNIDNYIDSLVKYTDGSKTEWASHWHNSYSMAFSDLKRFKNNDFIVTNLEEFLKNEETAISQLIKIYKFIGINIPDKFQLILLIEKIHLIKNI